MSDVKCLKCGEPWDSCGVDDGDMTEEEARRFRRGEGCPSCGFGRQCVGCDGTGRYREHYRGDPECCFNGKGIVLGRVITGAPAGSPHNRRIGQASIGYEPKVRWIGYLEELERKKLGSRTFPERIRSCGPDLGGVRWSEYWFVCPDCHGELPDAVCQECKGTGELTRERVGGDDEWSERVWSHMEASDEDPIAILEELQRGGE